MPAISVGSVEVDVVPNATGIDARLRAALVPPASQIGDEVGRIIGRQMVTHITSAVRDGINAGGRAARPAAARQGDETAGAFSRSLKARLEAAFRSLPKADVRLSTTGVDADLARLRARMESLAGKRIGIDIDAGRALTEVTDIEARLKRLGAQHPNVQVRADTAAALAQLAAFRAEVDAVDGKNVDVDTSSAAANFRLLTTAAIAFGPAIIPVLPVVAAGLGAIAAAGTAAAAGVGSIALVAVPAFVQMGKVLQAQKSAQDAATTATYKGAQASSQGAQKAQQMAGAQQALASAQRNASRQIADAERAVGDAVRQAAQNNERAAQQVKAARQSLADAYAQAAERMQQANADVSRAERDLALSQKSARQAQLDLTAARKEAAQQLEDLNNRLTDSALSQRDAEIALKEATAERNRVLESATATELDKQKAILQYDQAVQRLKEQTTETKRLKGETAAANKAGVEGSDTVRSAQERLASAQQDVTDKTTALKAAQQNVTKTQIQNSRAIADAQSKLAEAQKSVAETQRQGAETIARAQERVTQAQQAGADSVASAQRQIASASQSAAGGVDQAAIAQAKYRAELAKLTPEARGTLNAFLGLRTAFGDWSKSLQPAVMPLFTRALIGVRNTLPTLMPFVLAAADAIGILQDKVSAELKKPFWQGFKADLQGNVKPAIVGLGVAFGNVLKGMAGIIDGFLPHMDSISTTMQRITGRFADWATGLKGSPEFERFLSFSATHGPILADTFGKIAMAFLNVGAALSPLSGPLLKLLGGVAEAIGIIADKAPGFILLIYGIIVATKLWTLAMIAFNFVMSANPLVLIGLAILALVGFVIYAYNKFGWFRDLVQTVWSAIQTAALWVWNNVLKPVFNYIWQGLQQLGTAAMWLWTNAIKPAWDAISMAARILLTVITVAVILPIIVAFKVFGAIAGWLWKNAIKPAFEAIAALAVWLYRNVLKPQLDAMAAVFRAVARVGTWLWKNALSPAFHGIADLAKWLYTNAIKPAFGWIVDRATWLWTKGVKPQFDLLKAGVKAVGTAFKTAKDYIGEQWSKVSNLARKPVQYVVDVVYNNGIRGVWNKVASAFGAPSLPKFKFAKGGVMPGYTPGRDVHKFVSPTGGRLELSGGEAIMRPEFTKAVGSGFVNSMNALARSRGAGGVKAALAPVFGGNPTMPTDTSLKYADGGIFGWIGKAASAAVGAGSKAWNGIKKGASWLKGTLEGSARSGVKAVVNPLLSNFPGMDTGFGKLIRKIPDGIIDALFGYSKKADDKGAGGLGGPRIAAALKWAKTQAGLPYQWAGNGNPSWDCSGFMSAIESVIRGQKPHRRWATMAFSGKTAPPGWVYHGNSPFRVGITNAGVGHTAGTLGKTNVESRGGAGVVVGSRARGYKDSLFNSWYGFMPGKYDSGGYLQPGLNLAYNGTGRPEPVFTSSQSNALMSMAKANLAAGPSRFEGDLYLDSGEFLGKVRGEAQQVVNEGQQRLISSLNAN
ncbi:hypothetical protein OHV08_34280 [Streptomyces canus]|uniref:hypothetical protein n=1 Tax=Streptomyces canus TaxID=58343 RepID=UPI00324B8410